MQIESFVKTNISDFNTSLKTEEDVKIKVIVPYLSILGYSYNNLRFENSIKVQIGVKSTTVRSDIEVVIDGKVQMVIDIKNPHNSISERDIIQCASYAKLLDITPALYAVVTNGRSSIVTNVYTGQRIEEIPAPDKLLRDINKTNPKPFGEIQLREVKSALLTINEPKELYSVINRCKDIIEKKGLIRSDQSFREMTKIILVKMNEERRAKSGEGGNRFLVEYFNAFMGANEADAVDCMLHLFKEALVRYEDIYQDDQFGLSDSECIIDIVKILEPFSFLGTGDDIKGTVYEVFLKSTLRGELDQYFTPREVVEFIVGISDPNPGEVILDPACGSGGFLIQAFRYVNQKIVDSAISESEAKKRYANLINKCLWGHEADYDLHVLAKINLIMHGDGWNNIYQGNTLDTISLADNYFDKVLTNPPFTIKYDNTKVLSRYHFGRGKDSEELDILFVEQAINLLKEGGELYIVLPEGLLNTKRYMYFREWLLENSHLLLSVSLPEGTFITFGGSVSKTCVLGVRKKDKTSTYLH